MDNSEPQWLREIEEKFIRYGLCSALDIDKLIAEYKAMAAELAFCKGDQTAADPTKWGHEAMIQHLRRQRDAAYERAAKHLESLYTGYGSQWPLRAAASVRALKEK